MHIESIYIMYIYIYNFEYGKLTTDLGPYLILKVIDKNMIITMRTILYSGRFMEKHFHDLNTKRTLGEAVS